MKKLLLVTSIWVSFFAKSQLVSPLDTGLAYYPEYLMADTMNSRLIAFGDFSSYCFDTTVCPTGLEVWNGSNWEYWYKNIVTSSGAHAAQYNNRIYGTFNYYDSVTFTTALYSFSNQSDLDTLLTWGWSQEISDYCVWNNYLVMTGIHSVNGSLTGGIVLYDGTSWIPFGTQTNIPFVPVACIVFNSELYVLSSGTNHYLYKWNGSNWLQQGTPFTGSMGYISEILPYNGRIYVVGGFYKQDDPSNPGNFIAAWNGSQWSDVGGGTWNDTVIQNGNIYGAIVYRNKLYVGGTFTSAGGVKTAGIASWNDTLWCGYGMSLYNHVPGGDFAVLNDTMYFGIVADTIFGQKFNWIARWDGDGLEDSCGVQWVGLNENQTLKTEVSLFPNPAISLLNVSFKKWENSPITFKIINAIGETVLEKSLGNSAGDLTYPADISALANGLYYTQLQFNGNIIMNKFIKQE